MTLIVLLILAAVSLGAVFSDKGVFERAENAGAKYNEAKAREVLETVLLTDGQYEKNINPEYNQDDFLDNLIKSEIDGADVKGDVAIIGKYAYELDRSVPKIGHYLGLAKDLVFPKVTAIVELADNKKNATITINASENKDGINKIEIWLLGEKIKEYKYDPSKPEVTEPYIATQNGNYIIKAYGDLMASTISTVDGIVASVKFEPNGNNEWQKSHSTTVTIQETEDKVVKAKYVWINSITERTYYLWTMIETKSGEKIKWRSEGFNFDNEGPTITSFTATKYSETGITLSATAQDNKAGVVKFEFFIDEISKGVEEFTATKSSIMKQTIVNDLSMGEHSCSVVVYDELGNKTTMSLLGKTKMYTWAQHYVIEKKEYSLYELQTQNYNTVDANASYYCGTGYSFNENNGAISIIGAKSMNLKKWIESGITTIYSTNLSGAKLTKISGLVMNTDGNSCKVTITKYNVSQRTISTTKGSDKNSDVESNSRSTYPDDGIIGSVWYVYKGLM